MKILALFPRRLSVCRGGSLENEAAENALKEQWSAMRN